MIAIGVTVMIMTSMAQNSVHYRKKKSLQVYKERNLSDYAEKAAPLTIEVLIPRKIQLQHEQDSMRHTYETHYFF